jgi:hypothetical protein
LVIVHILFASLALALLGWTNNSALGNKSNELFDTAVATADNVAAELETAGAVFQDLVISFTELDDDSSVSFQFVYSFPIMFCTTTKI